MWWVLSSYPTIIGGISAIFIAFVVVAFTHHIFKSTQSSSESENQNSKHSPPRRESLKEHLKKHYTKEHLAEIARCAVMLDKLGSGDGEVVSQKLDSNNSYVDGDNKSENNSPQEEPDIFELLDISIDDEDDDQINDDVISPQARADIEAELLDTSMLSAASSEEADQPDIVPDEITKVSQEVELSEEGNGISKETNVELNESESEETEVLDEDDIINNQAMKVSDSALCVALSELGMESLIRDLDDNQVRECDEKVEESNEGAGDGGHDAVISEFCDLLASCVVRKAIYISRKQIKDEIRLSDVCNMRQPENVKCYQEVAKNLTENEMQEEERAQESQLNQILELMQQHPELFGDISKNEMAEQAALYCV